MLGLCRCTSSTESSRVTTFRESNRKSMGRTGRWLFCGGLSPVLGKSTKLDEKNMKSSSKIRWPGRVDKTWQTKLSVGRVVPFGVGYRLTKSRWTLRGPTSGSGWSGPIWVRSVVLSWKGVISLPPSLRLQVVDYLPTRFTSYRHAFL